MAQQKSPSEGLLVIGTYTRAAAIADGMLIDVTATAKEAGFKIHTAVTRRVWELCVRVPDGLEGQGQSEAGRLWDVVRMAAAAARRAPAESMAPFTVSVVDTLHPDGSVHREDHALWLYVGPGDQDEPVLTILFLEDR